MLIIHTQDIVEFRFNFQSKNLSERKKKVDQVQILLMMMIKHRKEEKWVGLHR